MTTAVLNCNGLADESSQLVIDDIGKTSKLHRNEKI